MSEIILTWLNDEVQLSKKITNFEKDFANGYLLGELLSKYNQQLNFHDFIDKDLRADKIKNHCLLEPTLKTLGVPYSAQVADEIIKQKKGTALLILYNLKMALEKVHNPADIEVFQKTGKLNSIQPIMTIKVAKEKYDKMESDLFSKRLNSLNKPQKELDLDKKLEKFRIIERQNIEKGQHDYALDREKERQIKEEMRKIQLNKLQRAITFQEDWQEKGRKEWEKNQKIGQDREDRERAFMEKTAQKRLLQTTLHQNAERLEVFGGIQEFEETATKQGIEVDHDQENQRKGEKSSFSVSAVMVKLKDKNIQSELARKERDKRRRKMIVDQAKAQRDIEIKKKEEILMEKLQQQSKQENEIAYEVWRAEQCKQVIIDNRHLRDNKYKSKLEEQTHIAQSKEEHLIMQYHEEKSRDIAQKKLRQKELQIDKQSSNRRKNYQQNLQIFDKIFEIADLCFQHLQDNDAKEIDPRFWRDACKLFVEEEALIPKKTFRHPDSTNNLTKPESSEIVHAHEALAYGELSDYLTGQGKWKVNNVKIDNLRPQEADLEVLKAPENNFNLGRLIHRILDLKFPAPEPTQAPADIPNYLPLKLLSIGYAFSGRKTLASHLREKYNIRVIQMNELIEEAFQLCLDLGDPRKSFANIDNDQQGALSTRSELREVGYAMRAAMEKGHQIPDELYIRAVVAKIKEFYPALTREEVIAEVSAEKEKEELRLADVKAKLEAEEARRKKKKKDSMTPVELELQEQANKRNYYSKGWILLGFPNNYEQLKALEQALSGFVPQDELPVTEAEQRKKRADLVVRAPPVEILPRKLIPGGIDCAIILDITKDEALRRALGRRVDPETGIVYHLEDNPPPVDQSPLCERLLPINDPENSEANLIDRLITYDGNRQEMEDWLRMFGFDETRINCLQKFEGKGSVEQIQAVVDQHLERLLEYKITCFEKMIDEANQAQQRAIEAEEERKRQEAEDARMCVIEPQVIKDLIDKVNESNKNRTIPTQIIDYLHELWDTIQENYLKAATEIFGNIKDQRNFVVVRLSEIQRRFIEIIQKKDDRLLHVLKFQQEYNKFVDLNPDMCEEDQTKEELHQRVEDLHQQLWEMIENKKEEATEERKNIMSSNYIEDEMEFFVNNMHRLIQAEIDRYFGSIQLISDYYNTLEGKPLPEAPENLLPEVLVGSADLFPPIETPEDPESFPRLELIYNNAVKILNGEEIEELVPKDVKGKGKAPPKKDDKKEKEKKKGKDEPVVEPPEPTPLEKELKETLNKEKAIMRYRLALIRTVAINRLKELRGMAKSLYTKLDDWIYYSNKCENDAVNQLCHLFGVAIEHQEKVQQELRLEYVDVIHSCKYLNFHDPPPVILPAKEILAPNRFSISQLKQVIRELKSITNAKGEIEDKLLLQYFARKTSNPLTKGDLPEDWQIRDIKSYYRLLKNLDEKATGFINFKKLCTFMCLLATDVPNKHQLDDYKDALLGRTTIGQIKEEAFTDTAAFFDYYESSPHSEASKLRKILPITRIDSIMFDRPHLIKQLLFYIHKDINQKREEYVDVRRYIDVLGDFTVIPIEDLRSPLKSPNKFSPNRPSVGSNHSFKSVPKTYTNVLFD